MRNRFSFGANWTSFNFISGPQQLEYSKLHLENLIGTKSIANVKIIDIGSGSGLHAQSFLELGAKFVKCIDIDRESVQTTIDRLNAYSADTWSVEIADILDIEVVEREKYDVVFSWGVLHHTGNLFLALQNASNFCKPGGLLVLAIYRKTWLCNFWKLEKRLYNNCPLFFRRIIDLAFASLILIAKWILGTSPRTHIQEYSKRRGMDFMTDIRDWLGGFPYESANPKQIENILADKGFFLLHSNIRKRQIGFFGSGCNEYVFQRR